MKRCSVCRVTKTFSEFARCRTWPDGRHYRCRSCDSDYQREWRRRNPEKMRRKRQKDAAWRRAKERDARLTKEERRIAKRVKDTIRARRWKEVNPERYAELARAGTQQRLARLHRAAGRASADQRQARWDYFGGLCWMCREPATEMDHVIALARGGPNWPSNLRPACRGCNVRKGARIAA